MEKQPNISSLNKLITTSNHLNIVVYVKDYDKTNLMISLITRTQVLRRLYRLRFFNN